MREFKAILEEIITKVSKSYPNDSGACLIYYQDDEPSALVQLLELDGTNLVNEYCLRLDRYLPEGYQLSHNSPTDGIILIIKDNYGSKITRFKRNYFLDQFRDLFKQRLLGILKGYPQYKVTLDYALACYKKTNNGLDAFLNSLNPDEEILHQLITMDIKSKSTIENSLLHWKKFKNCWYLDLPNGLTVCANSLLVYVSDISTDNEDFGQLKHCLWVSSYNALGPMLENNLYEKLTAILGEELAAKCSADIILIYNKEGV